MKLKVEIELIIDLSAIKPTPRSNYDLIPYIIEQLKQNNLRDAIYTNLDTQKCGNDKGFLNQMIESLND